MDIDVFYIWGGGRKRRRRKTKEPPVYCEIKDSTLFIGPFYQRIIKY